MAGARSVIAVSVLFVLAALVLNAPLIPNVFGTPTSNELLGTAGSDLIISGPEDSEIRVGAGDDLLIGGAGNNTYHIDAGDGHITLIETRGENVVEFGPGITFSHVASGLWRSGDDLRLVLGHEDRTLTIVRFFALKDTVASFQFENGQQLTAAQLFQVFGQPAPTTVGTPLQLRMETDASGLLGGTSGTDILVPSEQTQRVRGLAGNDYLIGRSDPVTFEIYPDNGQNLIIASSGHHEIFFRGGIHFNDVATQLQKHGDDLILGNRNSTDQVRIYRFFSIANTVVTIRFETGGQIQAGQLFELFGVPVPSDELQYALNVQGALLDVGTGAGDSGGDNGCGTNCGGGGTNPGDDDPDNPGPQLPDDLHWLVGTDEDDLIYVGPGDNLVIPRAGNDYVLGGPGDNLYYFEEGFGNNVIVETEGYNVVEFGDSVAYSNVTQGLVRAGNDLLLRVDSKGVRVTVKDFFVVANTIQEFRFHDGSSLTSAGLFQIFGVTPPVLQKSSSALVLGRGDTDVLEGSDAGELLVPRMAVTTIRPGRGDDYLVGRLPGGETLEFGEEGITFEISPGDGYKTIIADSALTNLKFMGDIQRQDIASNMVRQGDDLILRSEPHDVVVRVVNFFSRKNLIGYVNFESGHVGFTRPLAGHEILNNFSAWPDTISRYNVLIKGGSVDSCYYGYNDGDGFGLTDEQLSVPNNLPAVVSIPDSESWYSQRYVYQVRAIDADNHDLCFDLVAFPDGAGIDQYTGLLEWQPQRHQIGDNNFIIRVVDELGGEEIQEFNLTVQDPNRPPYFLSMPKDEAVSGYHYVYGLMSDDSFFDAGDLSYVLVSAPSGMELVNGRLVWSPSDGDLGVHQVVVEVIDPYGSSSVQSFDITVISVEDVVESLIYQSAIPKTGSRYSAYEGDDGSIKAGAYRLYERDNENHIVYDLFGGLVWQDNEDVETTLSAVSHRNGDYCHALELGGITNWRLPTRLELVFLAEHVQTGDRLYDIPSDFLFGRNVRQYIADRRNLGDYPIWGGHWAETVSIESLKVLWSSSGNVMANIRCVSGRPPFFPLIQRPVNGNVVVDRTSNLMWQDDSNVSDAEMGLSDALSYCSGLNLAGYEDWRVPNFNESFLLSSGFRNPNKWGAGFHHFNYVPYGGYFHSSTLLPYFNGIESSETVENYRFKYDVPYAGENVFHGIIQGEFLSKASEEIALTRCVRNYFAPNIVIADLGPFSLAVNELFVLDASNSYHVDGEIVAYEWTNLSTGEVLGTNPSVEVQFEQQGHYEVQLTVTDQLGLSQTLKSPIQLAVYGPPSINVAGQFALWAGDSLLLDASDSTDLSGIASFAWSNAVDGSPVATGPVLEIGDLEPGQHVFRITVTNVRGLAAEQDLIVTVMSPPEIDIDGDTDVHVGDTVTLDASRYLEDSAVATVKWLSAETGDVLADEAVLVLEGLQSGQHPFVLSIVYANGLTYQQTVDVQVSNHFPVIVVQGDQVVAQGDTINLDASASYVPFDEIVAFKWYAGDSHTPFHDSAAVSINGLAIGSWLYRLEVESSTGQVSSDVLTVQVGYRPVAQLPEIHFAYEDMPISLDGTGSSVEEGELSYQWTLQGEPVSQDAVAVLAGLPAGEYEVGLTVTTELGLTDSALLNLQVEPSREWVTCPLLPIVDDTYVAMGYPAENIEWRGNQAATVEDIARAFNYARSQDPSVFQYLVMPEQSVWDAMSLQEKGLYLVNAERVARGIKPYEGVDPDMVQAAQDYADFIHGGNRVIDHYADGRTPLQRMDAHPYLQLHRDNTPIKTESLASGTRPSLPSEDYALAKAIYGWLYQDKDWYKDFDWADGPAWGHRDHLLQPGLDENNGSPHAEGVVGFGVARGHYAPGQEPTASYGYVTAFKTLDQGEGWDTSRLQTVDISAAQGCSTLHVINLDESQFQVEGLQEIRLEPRTLVMVPDTEAAMTIVGVYDGGQTVDFTPYAQFTPDQYAVVAIEGSSLRAIQSGNAHVVARLGQHQSNRLHVHVRLPADLSNLEGTPAAVLLPHVPGNATIDQYDPMAMAAYTGQVLDRHGTPQANVQVTFLNRPELGSTRTDSGGRFVIAGPAGYQTLVYEKPGHLVVQRSAVGASNGWAILETVSLLPRDAKRTHITLGDGSTQIHQSTLISDEFGERQATVIFNNITRATVRSADGSERELEDFWFSATEFETPASMPGELPPETAFTFANDLHVAGVHYSDTVMFDNQVVMFIDNFLGFEVGEIIPIGYFDRLANRWVASPNGVVVRLVDQSGDGQVDGLDYTGNGVADDLNGSGYTWDDAIGLAAAGYQPGDTLWWGSFNHMTPYDYNLAPSDAEPPVDGEVKTDKETEIDTDCANSGSYCKLRTQSFHETIPVAGTGESLHYHSQRTPGYQHRINVRASGAHVPDSLEGIVVRVEIGGHRFEQTLPASPNQEAEFVWDGYNVDGSRTPGLVTGRVSIGYEYRGVFMSAGNAAEEERALDDFPTAWATLGDRATAVPGRESFISWQDRSLSVRNSYPSQLAVGWSLSSVHEFDRSGQLYFGSGGVQSVPAQSLILRTGQTHSLVHGDDGYYQAGGSVIDYTISDQGTLMDRVTGLEWEFTDRPQSFRTRQQAAAYCADGASLPGDGWRLPTTKEAGYTQSKVASNSGPIIYSPTRGRQLWHQSTANPDQRPLPVLCVRGETINQRYIRNLARDAAQSVVVDADNGLMWQDAPANASLKLNWQDSIAHCEASDYAGYDDWRLPNINELLYVLPNSVFTHQTRLVFPDGAVWNDTASFRKVYWSATSHHQNDGQAWGIESESFNSPRFNKQDAYHVRCVREAASAYRMPFSFDASGRLQASYDSDSGVTLQTYEYNDSGLLTAIVDRFDNRLEIQRNSYGVPTQLIAPDGQVTTLTITDNNHLQSVGYEDGGHFRFQYQQNGLLTRKTDPMDHVHVREYDEQGRLLETRNPEGGQWNFHSERLGLDHERYGYATAEGQTYQVERNRLANGDVRWATEYLHGGEKIRVLSADRLQEQILYAGTTTVIDKVQDPKSLLEIPQSIRQQQPSGLTRTITFDRQYAQNGADTTRYSVLTDLHSNVSTLDVDSRAGVTRQTSPEGRVLETFSDPVTLLTQRVVPAGLLPLEFGYDERGRLIEQVHGNRSTSYTYGEEGRGQITAITTADEQQTRFEYDALGRVTRIIYPLGHTVVSEYDLNGNQKVLVVPSEVGHTSHYNGVNLTTASATPLGETTQYEYDRDRRLKAIQLPSGDRIEHHYTGGLLTRIDLPERSRELTYHWGDQLSRITEGGESMAHEWDGDLLTEVTYQGMLNERIRYGYNQDFLPDQLSYAGQTSTLSYDRDGLLTGIHGFTIARDPVTGLPDSLTDGALNQSYTFDGYGELTRTTAGVNQVDGYQYELTRNLVGQITGKTETLPDGSSNTYSYYYDDRYRLTEVYRNGQRVEHYQYDANGNRLQATSTLRGLADASASYNQGDQLNSLGNTTYTYDANGRLSGKEQAGVETEYSYSSDGRLLQVITPQHTIDYRHNALGNRVAKLLDGEVVEQYLWQNKTTLLATYDGQGNPKQRFEYTLGHTPTRFTQDGETYYILSDHLGSPRVITNAQGDVIRSIDYDAYGHVIADSNPEFVIPFGFAGGLHDEHTGLVRFGYRDYDPHSGRWTARDPIGFAGGDTNLYGYVLGDPVNFIDPSGEIALIPLVAPYVVPALTKAGVAAVQVGGMVLAYVGVKAASDNLMHAKPGNQSRPKDAPRGTKPIDQLGLSRPDIHDIKDGVGASPNDWTGITPDGDVITSNPDGSFTNHGPADDYTIRPTGLCE